MRALFGVVVAIFLMILAGPVAAGAPLAGLQDDVKVRIDQDRVPHIEARNEHDLFFMQGWMHARDRLFQMDVSRRQASGTLAELLGAAALTSDVQLRTLGLRRAAELSVDVLTPASLAVLDAYAAGVNAYVKANPILPPEYGALGVSTFAEWSRLDSLSVGKLLAFSLSFDDDSAATISLQTYIGVGAVAGFNGQALYFQDLFRSAPFDPAASVPDAKSGASAPHKDKDEHRGGAGIWDRDTEELIKDHLERSRKVPLLQRLIERDKGEVGSNIWAVSGRLTKSGEPLLANDPHLGLSTPAIFYINHLRTDNADIDAHGHTFPGTPGVVLGQNRWIAWGATVTGFDVTDWYRETLVPCSSSPPQFPFCTVYKGNHERIEVIPQSYFVNSCVANPVAGCGVVPVPPSSAIPPATLIVPRRNNGPIIADLGGGKALSVQYTGFSGTAELQAILGFNKARDIDDFRDALQDFDFGSQNWMIIDKRGNVAYYTSAEVPLREDLQAGAPVGPGPAFIREGTGGNEWIRDDARSQGQAIPYKVLPFKELPQIVNPPAGYVINANNDSAGVTLDNNPLNQLRRGGKGIYYLSSLFDAGFRAGRITDLLQAKVADGDVTIADMKKIQADVVMLDAQVFTPHILRAFKNAKASGAHNDLKAFANHAGVAEAVGRLKLWNHSTPTGIEAGYDASDVNGQLSPPSQSEIANSVAATIYSVWRGRFIDNTIDTRLRVYDQFVPPNGMPRPGNQQVMTALRNLIEKSPFTGVGASGLDFFPGPADANAATRRDILLLKSLANALDALKGVAYAAAFDNSENQNDYRWGKLHRLTLRHPLGSIFNIPPAGGFANLENDLPGLAVDGGFGVVDASNHSVRAARAVRVTGTDDYTFGSGPARRFVATVGKDGIVSETSLPGGQSGVVTSPYYANLLGLWLTNDTIPSRLRGFKDNVAETLSFSPLATAGHDRDDD
jgi:penicillin G amidase